MNIYSFLNNHGISILALFVSVASFIDSRKIIKVQSRINMIEEKLKKYELEDKEKEREEATKACVEARIYNISRGKYSLKIWNSGKAIAYNVDFKLPKELEGLIRRDKVPFEFLEPGKSFEQHVSVFMGFPSKFNVTTTWTTGDEIEFAKDQIVTI